ncbi:hypothetical protein NE237_019753 [Protea cynaroides]|uniref:Uncharacterized protein n=1 Tax=Protea cynaroides TaxID=273540 RepID=A0A9Q0H7R1_9MAGN|nr:hypothetical protein NE237_019753 [Protea cynaroides]
MASKFSRLGAPEDRGIFPKVVTLAISPNPGQGKPNEGVQNFQGSAPRRAKAYCLKWSPRPCHLIQAKADPRRVASKFSRLDTLEGGGILSEVVTSAIFPHIGSTIPTLQIRLLPLRFIQGKKPISVEVYGYHTTKFFFFLLAHFPLTKAKEQRGNCWG